MTEKMQVTEILHHAILLTEIGLHSFPIIKKNGRALKKKWNEDKDKENMKALTGDLEVVNVGI